jgi:Homeodomain-like domain
LREVVVSVLAMIVESSVVEADLAAGRLCCPGCDGPLSPWGYAREREVRMLDGVRSLRPRRACCRHCERTHVLLPAWAVARRRDGVEVIGEALLAKANGDGHRRIAARLGRPPGTVRGWLRAFARRAELVAVSARRWTHAVDGHDRARGRSRGSPLVEALDELGNATRACRLRLRISASPWELAVALGWLHGHPRDPPAF